MEVRTILHSVEQSGMTDDEFPRNIFNTIHPDIVYFNLSFYCL